MSRDVISLRAALLWIPAALLVPVSAIAHDGAYLAPEDLWSAWTWDPWVVGGITLSAWLYARGLGWLWARAGVGRGVRRWQAGCFAGGLVAVFLALISPLDPLGGALFSAHMLQHVVLMLIAAPLLVLGNPLVAFLWGLPPQWRRRVGGWGRLPRVRQSWHLLTNPIAAWTLHAAAVWIWHLPVLYQATLSSQAVHIAQHLSFFGTALLFWWAGLEFGRRRRLNFGLGALYIFTTAVHSSLLGALLTFSLVLWYPAYAGRTSAWGLTPLEDQQLGGLVMWIPPGVIYLVATLALLAVGLRLGERPSGRSGLPGVRALPVRSLLLATVLLLGGCDGRLDRTPAAAMRVAGGDARLGPQLMRQYGCTACHLIPGVRGADGLVGPPLSHWSQRVFIAGLVPNTPENLVAWINDPQRIHPQTAMPNMGVTPDHARHIAAFLYTLR